MSCADVQTIQAGNGTKTQFSFDFPYLFKTEIEVSFWNATTKEWDVKATTDATYPWQVTDANPTIVEFTSTAPPSPTTPTDPNESSVDNVRIRRTTSIDDIRALFSPGSAIRSDDLNKNFEQLRYAIQEANCQGVTDEVYQYLLDNYWDRFDNTLYSADAWRSDDATIATTAALDQRFQDEVNDTLTKAELAALSDVMPDDDVAVPTTGATKDYIDHVIETDILVDGTGLNKSGSGGQVTIGISAGSVDLDRIKAEDIITSAESNPNNDTTIATTAKIDDMIDAAITGDIASDGTGITVTDDGDGTITLGIAANSVDFDRIKNSDIITRAEQDAGTAEADTNIFTALAAAKRFDTLVQTSNPGLVGNWETGKTWLQNNDDLTLSIWNGSGWVAITSGGTFTSQPNVVYVDVASGNDNNNGHRISTPKASITSAIEQINGEISLSTTVADGFNGGSGYVDAVYSNVSLTHSSGTGIGTGLTASITVSSGAVTAITLSAGQQTALEEYSIGDVLTASNADLGGSGSGLLIPITGAGDGQIVVVSAGTYQEAAPIQIKRRNVSIIGQALRSCLVHPTTATENNVLFELNSGSFISNLTLTGVQAGTGTGNTLDADLPTDQGWNFGFYDGAFIVKSPYIQNCTNFSDSEIDNDALNAHNPDGGAAGDTDSAPTGGGMLVNGAAVADDSPLRSMVADSYTHVGLNGPGVLVVNNGYAQITSSYAFFNKYHIKCLTGGQANLAASTTDFGDQALVADGRSTNAIFTSTTIADAADQATEFFIEGPTARTATPLPWHGSSTRPQSNMLVDIGGNTYPILSSSNTFDADEIISGRDYTILTVGDTDFTAIGAASNTVGVQFTATGVGTGSGTVTDDTGWRVTISRPDPADRSVNLGLDGAVTSGGAVSFFLRSQVASSGHTMEYVGSGTNYLALPENGGVPDETKQITELNNGKVWTAITDHNGKFKIGGNQTTDPIFEVDQQTGFITIPEGAIAFNLLSDATPQLGGNLDVNGSTITGLSNPTANDEVANKAYVDAVAGTPTQIAQLNTSVAVSDTGTNGTITFTNDGSESARIDSSGRLLIGQSDTTGIDGEADNLVVSSTSHTGITVRSGSNHNASVYFADQDAVRQGRIEYNHGSNYMRFNTNGSEVVRIDSNGRLGVGNSSPGSFYSGSNQLVVGNTGDQGITIKTGTSDIGRLHFADGTTGNQAYRGRIEYVHASDYMQFGTAGRNSDLVIDINGRVGIGTTSPGTKLQVDGSWADGYGTLNITGPDNGLMGVGFRNSSTYLGGVFFRDGTAGDFLELNAQGSRAIRALTNGNERVRIDSSGRLLVGTPTARSNFYNGSTDSPAFQIEGTGSNDSHASIVRNQGGEGATLILGCSGGTSLGSNTLVSNGDRIGHINFQATDGAEFVQAANIKAEVDGTPGANDMPGRLVFSTTANSASSPTERMRIDSSGRVKIGNDTNYSAATGSKLAVELMGTAGTILEIADQTSGFSTFESVKNAGGTATDYGGYIFSGRRDADDDVKEYLRIDSSGRVRIGNAGQSIAALNVHSMTNGNIHFRPIVDVISSGTGVAIDVLNDASTAVQDLAIRGATTIFRNASGETMRLDSSGNLKFNSGYGSAATAFGVRAWINFNGAAGTIGAGRGSGNVSSVSDLGTGQYQVNWSTGMPDTNYCVIGGNSIQADSSTMTLYANRWGGSSPSNLNTSYVQCQSYESTSNQQKDMNYGYLIALR